MRQMSPALKQFLLISGAFISLWILWSAFFNAAMDTLDFPFSIELGGASIVQAAGNAEEPVQAKTGFKAAIFTLKDGRLSSGDFILGRYASEDRSFLPKPVLWFKKTDGDGPKVQRVTAKEKDGSFQLIFSGAGLIVEDGQVFADLSGNDESKLVAKN
ncbi:hypothetical protein HYQ45_000990 [Verticillium longisporum]|uniref:Uncharacterized protein n=2 Tax=Verticillium TaxID=1036719 RepID=A0A8I3AWH6_VERLO|nr:hypothetical protein HYQ45_000990 [Verticillium longisporum]PNH41371.1 hypothetical protein VD0004_g5753 [Verticillium dahliae]PNH71545.1 hypothetical protein VD0001_g6019 [Verticillium dahliae]